MNRKVVVGFLVSRDRTAFQVGNGLIQHFYIAGRGNITTRRQWQPEIVIRTSAANAPAARRVPPMLDISFNELTRRGPEKMFSQKRWLSVYKRHYILQLIAKSKRAAR